MNVQRTGFRRTEICNFGENNKIAGAPRSEYFFNPGQNFVWNFLFHANFRNREKEIASVPV